MKLISKLGQWVFLTLIILMMINGIAWLVLRTQWVSKPNPGTYFELNPRYFQMAGYKSQSSEFTVDASGFDQIYQDAVSYYLNPGKSCFRYFPGVDFVAEPVQLPTITVMERSDGFTTRSSGYSEPDKLDSAYVIFCLGGSTTFGSYVSDGHTWPALLGRAGQDFMPAQNPSDQLVALNFGCSAYTPSQETFLLIQLLKHGHRPSAVLFMDGFNVGPPVDGSEYSEGISRAFSYASRGKADWPMFLFSMPVVRLLVGWLSEDDNSVPFELSVDFVSLISNRFIENARIRNALAEIYGFEIRQYLQPVPFIEYDLAFLVTSQRQLLESDDGVRTRQAYQSIYNEILDAEIGFFDLSGTLSNYGKPALVDGIHYGPDFNRYLANQIAADLDWERMNPYRFEPARSTGRPFN